MAQLDVTEVLLDPLFADSGILCERMQQTVGDDGIAVQKSAPIRFAGVVTNDSGDVLTRLATGERTIGNIVIHTKYRLIDGQEGRTADVVTWRNRKYTVSNVKDWSNFGRGFVAATCDLLPVGQ